MVCRCSPEEGKKTISIRNEISDVAMRAISTKAGIASGFVGLSVFLAMYSIAMASDSEYTFFENYLSDLGVGPGAWAFNSGVIIAGALLALFAVFGLGRVMGEGRLARAATVLLALCGVFLIGIGVFNEDVEPYHYIFSVSYFLTFFFALIVVSASLYVTRALRRFGVITSVCASVFGLLLLPMGGNPQSETLAVLAMVAWGLLMSCAAMLKEYGRELP